VNLYGRAVGNVEEVPKAKRHDHLPGVKGYFNAAALPVGAGLLWVSEGAFDALALLAAGVPRVVAIFGVQVWRWDWAREVHELVFALYADMAGQQWRQLARQAALRGKRVAVLPAAAYGGCKDVSDAWATGC
jgi:DNA primase